MWVQKRKRIQCIILTIVISFLSKIVYLLHPFSIKMVSDNSGCLLGCAYLAGLDWRQAAVSNYYGQGWYIIYSFLFRLTDDAYLIYKVMIISNIVFISSVSILIYIIMVKFLECSDGIFTVLSAAVCVHFISDPGSGTRISNEPPVFIFTWIICFFLMYTYYNKDDRKKFMKGLIGLVVFQSYALLIHTRMIVIIIAIVLCTVLFWLYYREWIIKPSYYIPLTILVMGVTLIAKKCIVSVLWQSDNPEGIHNYNVGVERIFKRTYTIKSILDVLLSNIYKLIINTDGILCIGIILFVALMIKIGRNLIRKTPVNRGSSKEKMLFIMFVTFFLCVIISICGIVILYSDAIALGYASKKENDRFSGLTYIRYYFSFAGPMLLSVLVTAKNSKELISKYYKWVFPAWFLLFAYIFLSVAPELNQYLSRLSRKSYTEDVLTNIFITSHVIMALLIFFSLMIKYDKICLFVGFMLLGVFYTGLGTIEKPYLEVYSSTAGAAYSLIRSIEGTVMLPQKIYTYNIRKDETQLLLNRYSIIALEDVDAVKEQEAVVVITGKLSEQDQNRLLQVGYTGVTLDNNEMIWSNSTEILECIK